MNSAELNYAWAATLADTLVKHGVRHLVVCPGSRSAPLALAMAERSEFKVWPIPDERSAAFFALGIGMATQTPAAVIVTSGTAGANAYPAVIEASMSQVPLVVVTANRPPELHGFGSLQTIDQHRLFGSYAELVALPLPEEAVATHMRATVGLALARHLVVHLDVPFREPLSLKGAPIPPPLGKHTEFPKAQKVVASVNAALPLLKGRVAIVAGPNRLNATQREAVVKLSERLSAPILAEGSSGFRFGPSASRAVAHYEAVLRAEGFAVALRPDLIIRVGGPLTTRVLQGFVDTSGAAVVMLSEPNRVCDPHHTAQVVLEGDTGATALALASGAGSGDADYFSKWLELDRRVESSLERNCEGEPQLARTLLSRMPSPACLMVSNSMPIRDVDAFASKSSRPLEVFSSRGASGIDGIVSTAFGIAAARSERTVLLVGDTAFLHDVGGLLWGSRLGLSLSVVVVNNAGGKIFEFLPVAEKTERFSQLFLMPPQVSLKAVSEAAGARFTSFTDSKRLAALLPGSLEGGVHVLEANLADRDNVSDHQRLWAQVKEALS